MQRLGQRFAMRGTLDIEEGFVGMTLTIELPDMLATPLKAEAQAQGVSPTGMCTTSVERALLTPSRLIRA